jgi:hypothetical protein
MMWRCTSGPTLNDREISSPRGSASTYSTNLTYTNYPTYDAVIAAITSAVASANANAPAVGSPPVYPWLFFVNFDPSLLGFTPGVGFQQLGFSAFAAIPGQENVNIYVENASGHIAYANTSAFTTVGITAANAKQKAHDGGWYDVVNNQLTGVMFEPPSFTPFLKHAPSPSLTQAVKAMTGFLSLA